MKDFIYVIRQGFSVIPDGYTTVEAVEVEGRRIAQLHFKGEDIDDVVIKQRNRYVFTYTYYRGRRSFRLTVLKIPIIS